MFSNPKTNISNLCGTIEGASAVTTRSSLLMYRDDMESKRKRDINLVKNYNNTASHTVAKGMSIEMAGSIRTENLDMMAGIPAKIMDGRVAMIVVTPDTVYLSVNIKEDMSNEEGLKTRMS